MSVDFAGQCHQDTCQGEELVASQFADRVDAKACQQFVVLLGEAGKGRWWRGQDLVQRLILVRLVECFAQFNGNSHSLALSSMRKQANRLGLTE